MSKTVLVGVDEHPTARDAVALATALAAATDDDLVVAHVYPLDPIAGGRAPVSPVSDPFREEALEIVDGVIADAATRARALAVAARSIAHGLHSAATDEGAELIVVGPSHRSPIGRATLGTNATRVVHGAPCAVAVGTRGLALHGLHATSIAVALDGSEESADALAFARRLAAGTGAQLRLVAVLPPQLAQWGRYRYVPDEADYAARARTEAQRVLAAARDGEGTEIREGHVAAALVEVSHEADLLVVGSRSYGPTRRVLLGSVSDAVIRNASCPVVVMPRSARAQDAPAAVAPPSVATT